MRAPHSDADAQACAKCRSPGPYPGREMGPLLQRCKGSTSVRGLRV